MLSARLRWACGWEKKAVSLGLAIPGTLRKERKAFCLRSQVGRGNAIFELSYSETHSHGVPGPVNIQMITNKGKRSSVREWGSILHFKAKEKRVQAEMCAESPGASLL